MLGIFLYTKFYNAFAISEKKVNGKSVNKKNPKTWCNYEHEFK
jgi:hypothetical protein